MLYDELLQEFASQTILMDVEDAKQRFDNTLAHLKSLKKETIYIMPTTYLLYKT